MQSSPRFVKRALLLTLTAATLPTGLHAQTCASPIVLVAATTAFYSIDTCAQNDPAVVCDGTLSTGGAEYFRLYLSYPVGYGFSVTPQIGSFFDPAIFIRRHDQSCSGSGTCAFAYDTSGPSGTESFGFEGLESGDYDVIVTSVDNAASTNCGQAMVNVGPNLGGGEPGDGVFIASFEY